MNFFRDVLHDTNICSGARALRNLSVNSANKMAITRLGAITHLRALTELPNERISQQGGYFTPNSIVTQTLILTRIPIFPTNKFYIIQREELYEI